MRLVVYRARGVRVAAVVLPPSLVMRWMVPYASGALTRALRSSGRLFDAAQYDLFVVSV